MPGCVLTISEGKPTFICGRGIYASFTVPLKRLSFWGS